MRWCEENTLHFVKLYLDKEYLWNPAHEWYKNQRKRLQAYSEIIKQFKTLTGKCMIIPEVKMKIKNLRSTYTQEVQKIVHKSRPDHIYKTSLGWFHEMDRCLKYVTNSKIAAVNVRQNAETITRQLDAIVDEAEWSGQDNQDSSLEDETSDPLTSVLLPDIESELPQQGVIHIKLECSGSPEESTCHIPPKPKRKKQMSPYLIHTHIEKYLKEDEFDIYGKFIASQLRKMDRRKALKIQLQIQTIVNKARISEA